MEGGSELRGRGDKKKRGGTPFFFVEIRGEETRIEPLIECFRRKEKGKRGEESRCSCLWRGKKKKRRELIHLAIFGGGKDKKEKRENRRGSRNIP